MSLQRQQNTPTLAVLCSCLFIVRQPCVDLSHHFVGFSLRIRDSCWKMCGLYFYALEIHQNLWNIGIKKKRENIVYRKIMTVVHSKKKKKKDQLSGFILSMLIFLCQKILTQCLFPNNWRKQIIARNFEEVYFNWKLSLQQWKHLTTEVSECTRNKSRPQLCKINTLTFGLR